MFEHIPVLLDEAILALNIKKYGIYIDGTFGLGGHSSAILKSLQNTGSLWVLDKDPEAIDKAQAMQAEHTNMHVYHGSFANLKQLASTNQLTGKVNGILLDLGVSSPQLDNANRGFSFQKDGPLDMRMDPTHGEPVAKLLQHISEAKLADIFWHYGEERYAKRLAKIILTRQKSKPITTTKDLADIIKNSLPYNKHKHPATRCFQALRIFINDELTELEKILDCAYDVLATGGKLVVISFHSLEDRIVKQFMRAQTNPKEYPRDLPIRANEINQNIKFRWVVKREQALAEELSINQRSRSAILRAIEKT